MNKNKVTPPRKLIFHIDMNAFFCQCAIIREPFLAEVPFIIGKDFHLNKGIVLTSNYLARKDGIYSGMNIKEAQERNPNIRIVPPDYPFYEEKSLAFFAYLKTFTPIIYPASIDEAYLDLTAHKLASKPLVLAHLIQSSLLKLYQLPSSIGISNSLFLAKMGSDFHKPLGITSLLSNYQLLDSLKVSAIYGIGRKTAEQLVSIDIKTIGDFKNSQYQDKIINQISKPRYYEIIDQLNGLGTDDLPSLIRRIRKSISREHTFNDNIFTDEQLTTPIKKLFDDVHETLLHNKLKYAQVVFIKYKNRRFESRTKQLLLAQATNDKTILLTKIMKLVGTINLEDGIRLIGVGVTKLTNNIEYDLFSWQGAKDE